MSEASNSKKQPVKPVKIIREGAIAASIWKRQAPSGYTYLDFSLSRSWKAQTTGKEGYSNNFFASNETQLLKVITEASAWIASEIAQAPGPDNFGTEISGSKKAA